ncbi:MAG TPA: hypothetical protein VK348_08295, partial [Planctomycetota bacterium]|nr:hypothetical protein [Planctomycetota bacterium]
RPDRQVDLLESMAFLVELAARHDPAFAELLRSPTEGLGADAAVIADGYLAEAVQHGAGRTVREQRIFAAPRLCAALLRADARASAIAVADLALAAVGQVTDDDARAAWQATLGRLRAFVADPQAVPLAQLRADPALAPLLALPR